MFQLFSADATMFSKTMKKNTHKSCPLYFYSIANRPKISPNLNSVP